MAKGKPPRRLLSPLEQHQRWMEEHGGWEKAQQYEREGCLRDFSEAPIKKWYDRHYGWRYRQGLLHPPCPRGRTR